MKDRGVIKEITCPGSTRPEYDIYLSSLGKAKEVLEYLGTKKINYLILLNSKYNVGSKGSLDMSGRPLSTIKLWFSGKLDVLSNDLETRAAERIILRRGFWHEIMEMTILAINGRVFNDPGDVRKLKGPETLTSFAHYTTADLLAGIGDDQFYLWEIDDEDKTDEYDIWAHHASAIPDGHQKRIRDPATKAGRG